MCSLKTKRCECVWQHHEKKKNHLYLWSHAAPEVGVCRSGLQHGCDDSLIFSHQFPQHIPVGEQVVAVSHLQTKEKGTILTGFRHKHASTHKMSPADTKWLIEPQRHGSITEECEQLLPEPFRFTAALLFGQTTPLFPTFTGKRSQQPNSGFSFNVPDRTQQQQHQWIKALPVLCYPSTIIFVLVIQWLQIQGCWESSGEVWNITSTMRPKKYFSLQLFQHSANKCQLINVFHSH